MRSNCFIEAWERYRSDQVRWLHMRKSRYSRWHGKIPAPVRWLARMALYPVFALYAALHMLAFETWPHFAWSDAVDEHAEEYVPQADKMERWFPPLFFDGIVRRVNE
jgi:hypothetical protein